MTQDEFKSYLLEKLQCTSEQLDALYKGLAESLRTHCANLEAIAIPGFGTFQPVKSDEVIVVDEATGRRTLLPPSIAVKFMTSVVLKKQLV